MCLPVIRPCSSLPVTAPHTHLVPYLRPSSPHTCHSLPPLPVLTSHCTFHASSSSSSAFPGTPFGSATPFTLLPFTLSFTVHSSRCSVLPLPSSFSLLALTFSPCSILFSPSEYMPQPSVPLVLSLLLFPPPSCS